MVALVIDELLFVLISKPQFQLAVHVEAHRVQILWHLPEIACVHNRDVKAQDVVCDNEALQVLARIR